MKMVSISVFSDIVKFTELRWKNADFSTIQRVCHFIHIFIRSSLGEISLCQVSLLSDMRVKFLGGSLFDPRQSVEKLILKRVKLQKQMIY